MTLRPGIPSIGASLAVLACAVTSAPAAAAAPSPSLDAPVSGSATSDTTPAYAGTAGDAPEDLPTVTVTVYGGSTASGEVVQTLTATRSGTAWSVGGSAPLADGTYTAQAQQSDTLGETGSSSSATFTIDTTRPETTVVSAPAGPTNDPTPGFTFSSPDAARFLCRLHVLGDAGAAVFEECSSPHTAQPLGDGSYVFEVSAVDAAGNQDDSPESRGFVVDTVAPRTTIVAGPGSTTARSAELVFSAGEPASFSCRLDGGAWERCGSPKSYSGLAPGAHQFEVRGSDDAGNEESSPAGHSWQVLMPGLTIPGVRKQAVFLAGAVVAMRNTLRDVPLRRLSRRRTVPLAGLQTLTAGTVRFRATARLRPRRRGPVRRVALLVARREVPAAGTYRLEATLTKRGSRLARHRRRLPVELSLTFTDVVGRSLHATMRTTMKR
jgi:Big-like domain-containing protein